MKTIISFKSIEFFSTERLVAFKVTTDDLEKFAIMHSDTNVMETLGGLRTAEQTQENLDWNLRQWRENGFGLKRKVSEKKEKRKVSSANN